MTGTYYIERDAEDPDDRVQMEIPEDYGYQAGSKVDVTIVKGSRVAGFVLLAIGGALSVGGAVSMIAGRNSFSGTPVMVGGSVLGGGILLGLAGAAASALPGFRLNLSRAAADAPHKPEAPKRSLSQDGSVTSAGVRERWISVGPGVLYGVF